MSNSYLSIDFLSSKGVEVTKPLRDWLVRATFLAKNRGSTTERQRYENWAVQVIEDALKRKSGIASVDWTKISPVMPLDAPECRPSLIHKSQPPSSPTTPNQDSASMREALYAEAMKRAPVELRSYVVKAFDLYDKDVASGKRGYHQVSYLEMLNISRNLYNHELKQRRNGVVVGIRPETLLTAPTPAAVSGVSPSTAAPTIGMDFSHRKAAEVALPAALPSASSMRGAIFLQPVGASLPVSTVSRKRPREKSPFAADDKAYFNGMTNGRCAKTTSNKTFIGTSVELERVYSRYEPTVEDIRPLHVLKKAFAFLCAQGLAKERSESRQSALKYLNEQLKGMRQDIRVQNIADNFAVSVYELHARLCLEIGDIGEFNQCQAALKRLYLADVVRKSDCKMPEFFCYRLAYLSLSQQYDALSTELINYTNAQMKVSSNKAGAAGLMSGRDVQRVLKLCEACDEGDCIAISRYLVYFPKEMGFLIRIYLPRLRVRWLREILCGLRGSVSIRFLMSNLGFTLHRIQCKNSPSGGTSSGEVHSWIDGTREQANKAFSELFEMLKITLPADFLFEREIDLDSSREHHGSSRVSSATSPSLDASEVRQLVEQHISYLSTRKDANI